ncbi:holo-ACP synthase [Asticcacaulis sp. SL142]|uniref:holo-ACP synthase n=1 Tax=Asticcacaulis sp. SL142 TaxID=2995155 RepID=UPI00226C881A|nr:holo-ACP synthase [Asticcacaulis sp. SL142]WAC48785.1 holo-ACP synthase [Asticcacaulis sp. SL142]
MIVGIGNDLVDARRIEQSIENFGEKFLNRIFTADEQARAQAHAKPVLSYAKRFAAKEAVAKALGTGISGFRFIDIEVFNNGAGKPEIILHRRALERMKALVKPDHNYHIHLSLSDEWPYASAYAVIEALPLP